MPKKFKKFNEFVKDTDKEKAPVKKIADYVGPIKNAPPGGGKPYAATGGKTKKGSKVGCDWTDKGDKSLVYNPKIDQDTPDKKSVKEFVEATKNMSPAEFAKFLSKNNANIGETHQSIEQTCKFLATNPVHINSFIAEARRTGVFENLIDAALDYQEGFNVLAKLMGDRELGESTCRRLVRAMNEMVGPPMHHNMGGGSLDMGDKGMGGPPPHGHPGLDPMHHGGDDDMDLDMDDEDEEGEENHHHMHDDLENPHETGLDDEDDGDDIDGMDMDDQGMEMEPHQHPHHGAGVGLQRHKMGMQPPEGPRPSMMSRMMSRESTSPAFRNFVKAING